MMAKCINLPDPIEAHDAALWPENVTTPALIDFGTGTSALVETFEAQAETGQFVRVARLQMIGVGVTSVAIELDATMLGGLLVALNAAAKELQAVPA